MGATYTLRARIRNASTSPSNRAPSAEIVPVRRATRPSTASSARATAASVTSSATGGSCQNESAASAATPPASVARASVTQDAGPNRSTPWCAMPNANTDAIVTPQTTPTVKPAAPSPAVSASTASSRIWAIRPITGGVWRPLTRARRAAAAQSSRCRLVPAQVAVAWQAVKGGEGLEPAELARSSRIREELRHLGEPVGSASEVLHGAIAVRRVAHPPPSHALEDDGQLPGAECEPDLDAREIGSSRSLPHTSRSAPRRPGKPGSNGTGRVLDARKLAGGVRRATGAAIRRAGAPRSPGVATGRRARLGGCRPREAG